MPLELRLATSEDEPVFGRLVQLYLHECSRYSHQTPDDDGLFATEGLEALLGSDKKPYLFWLAGRLAGFSICEETDDGHKMDDFFVLWPYRRLGVGEEVARIIFDEHPGPWSIPYDESNDLAKTFWRAVVYRYSRKDFAEVRESDGWTTLRFESVKRPGPGVETTHQHSPIKTRLSHETP